VPPEKHTDITVGTAQANSAIDGLRENLNNLHDREVNVHVTTSGETGSAEQHFFASGGLLGYAQGGQPPSGVPGLAAAGVVPWAWAATLPGVDVSRGYGPTRGPRAVIGEGNPTWPEWVVATDPSVHGPNFAYWLTAGRQLGLSDAEKKLAMASIAAFADGGE